MTRFIHNLYGGEILVSKRFLVVAVLVMAVCVFAAVPAFAEGYNSPQAYTRAEGYASGPHGGYNTSTNKCQDCHSTHYASGSYVLLRANSREAACDYCHVGGGGSAINIQMDNEYDADSAIASNSMGSGTGHTLGYKGKAPADISPAFSDAEGLACFDCHTPHGNSARVLEPYGIPGRPAGEGYITEMYSASFMTTQMYRIQEMFKVKFDMDMSAGPQPFYVMPSDFTQMPGTLVWSGAAADIKTLADPPSILAAFGAWNGSPGPDAAQMGAWYASLGANRDPDGYHPVSDAEMGALFALFDPTLMNLMQSWEIYWGIDVDQGNIATKFWNMGNWQYNGDGTFSVAGTYTSHAAPEVEVWNKPLFPKGRFLLLKNPDSGDDYTFAEGGVNDMGMPSPDMKIASGVEANEANGKKVGIDWDWPLGPAASWGPFFSTDDNERFPLAFPWAPTGVGMQNEFCTSCHDGAAGQSTQAAEVWYPNQNWYEGSAETSGTYVTAYSHDSNNRGCARAQYLNPGDGNNFGPHCRNCHTGAAACQQCHDAAGTNWEHFGKDAYAQIDPDGSYVDAADLLHEGRTGYQAVSNIRAGAVEVGYQCVDGGFSFPHRTLGANMLKDQLYGIDFDGTPVAPGDTRMTVASVEATFGAAYFAGSFGESNIAGAVVQNLDSVCIDCHGDATYWNGDDPTYFANFNSGNPLGTETWNIQGWELLLKGLP